MDRMLVSYDIHPAWTRDLTLYFKRMGLPTYADGIIFTCKAMSVGKFMHIKVVYMSCTRTRYLTCGSNRNLQFGLMDLTEGMESGPACR